MEDEKAAPRGGDGPKNEPMTAEEFVTKAPLYVKVPISFHPPREISFDCWHEKCSKETSWLRTDEPVVVGSSERGGRPADYDIKSCSYRCVKCQEYVLTVVYRVIERGKTVVRPRLATGVSSRPTDPPAVVNVVTQVMKVGQYPAPSVTLPKDLERNLGEDAAQFYRRARICRNNGFGLAAATYIRRVVEDKTNELIELAAEVAESHQLDEATVAAIRLAADSTVYTRFEDKLQYASTVFPATLLVGDYNPLKTLYSLVSEGIHGLSEEECISIADDTSAVFEYLFSKLRADMTERNQFVERMKRLNQPGRKPEAGSAE
jgi:hypothetical protein